MSKRSQVEALVTSMTANACGLSAKGILEDIEFGSSVDRRSVKAHLQRDIRSLTGESVEVKLTESGLIISLDSPEVHAVVDTYVRVYPELSFLFES